MVIILTSLLTLKLKVPSLLDITPLLLLFVDIDAAAKGWLVEASKILPDIIFCGSAIMGIRIHISRIAFFITQRFGI